MTLVLPAAALVNALPLGAINWHTVFFLLFAVVACGSAIAVVVADSIVRMAPHRAIRPISIPKSPTRLTMKALFAAVEALFRS